MEKRQEVAHAVSAGTIKKSRFCNIGSVDDRASVCQKDRTARPHEPRLHGDWPVAAAPLDAVGVGAPPEAVGREEAPLLPMNEALMPVAFLQVLSTAAAAPSTNLTAAHYGKGR